MREVRDALALCVCDDCDGTPPTPGIPSRLLSLACADNDIAHDAPTVRRYPEEWEAGAAWVGEPAPLAAAGMLAALLAHTNLLLVCVPCTFSRRWPVAQNANLASLELGSVSEAALVIELSILYICEPESAGMIRRVACAHAVAKRGARGSV